MDAWTPGWIDCQMVRYTRTTRFAWGVSGEPGMDTRRPSPRWWAVMNPTSRRNSCRSPRRRGLSIEMYKPQRRSGVAATESPSFSLVRKRSASRGIRAHIEIDAAGDPPIPDPYRRLVERTRGIRRTVRKSAVDARRDAVIAQHDREIRPSGPG